MPQKIPVIVIFAPTASGKTALAVNLFGKSSLSVFKGKAEIVSADSMQIYKKLDIGTAKPTEQERAELPHHLIDIRNFDEPYSVSDFVNDADKCCKEIYSRDKIPIVMGGTGFYIRNFILGLPQVPQSNEKIRTQLKECLLREGTDSLYDELLKIDGESASKINKNDSYRIIRALEIFYSTGQPRSSFMMNAGLRDKYDFCIIILKRERNELYARIDMRVEQMFKDGLENEVRSIIALGASAQTPSMKSIGYREWFSDSENCSESLTNIKDAIKRDSRRYAKKQFTFMRGIPDAKIISVSQGKNFESGVEKIISDFLRKFYIL